jgi:4-amino-4-deoxy-L-arabinose transferase-like glycosyltransferase
LETDPDSSRAAPVTAWNGPWTGLMAACLFILLSAAFIPYAGFQDDEALFASPLYEPIGKELQIRAFHHNIPLMMMSYLGTLKTALYWRWLPLAGSSVWAVRLPMAFVGAITIFFFYRLVLLSGTRSAGLAAGLGAFLLATDPVFLLTNTFDWGPVALEHVLLVTGCFLLARFGLSCSGMQQSRIGILATGSFLFGLALWDKALFLWALSGVTVAAALVYWPEVRRCLSRRHLAVAAASLFIGALPFVIFNLRNRGATAGENVHWSTERFSYKWLQLRDAANGSSLFGFMAGEDSKAPKPAVSIRGHIASWVQQTFGQYEESGFDYAFVALLAAVPLWWRSRPARFALVFLCVTWGMMALTKDAGGAAHHDVLLWPFPMLFAAATLAALPWRWLTILAGTGLVIMNLLVVNQYLVDFDRNGAAGNFTDALFPLSQALPDGPRVWVLDWGIGNSVQLAHRGQLNLRYGAEPLGQAQLLYMLEDSSAIFVDHVPERQIYRDVPEHLNQFATSQGYRKQLLQTISDSNGRPVFQVFQYAH